MKKKIMITGSVLTLCTLGTLGAAYAATTPNSTTGFFHKNAFFSTGSNGEAQGSQKAGLMIGINGQKLSISDAVAKDLGIDAATLKQDLQSGKSLAQIAQSKGISEDTLISDLESNFKSQLDQAVTNGKLTSDTENKVLTTFDSHLKQMVEAKGGQRLVISRNGDGNATFSKGKAAGSVLNINGEKFSISNVVSKALGIDSATLKTDLQNGQTLAQIAQSKGLSEDTLISDLESSFKSDLDQAVVSGKLTSDVENNILTKFDSNAKQMVEGTGPVFIHKAVTAPTA